MLVYILTYSKLYYHAIWILHIVTELNLTVRTFQLIKRPFKKCQMSHRILFRHTACKLGVSYIQHIWIYIPFKCTLSKSFIINNFCSSVIKLKKVGTLSEMTIIWKGILSNSNNPYRFFERMGSTLLNNLFILKYNLNFFVWKVCILCVLLKIPQNRA